MEITEEEDAEFGIRLKKLVHFRKINNLSIEDTDLEIPTPAKNRDLTDKKGCILFAIITLIYVPLMCYYVAQESDIRRLLYHYDQCANFCGVKNKEIHGLFCSGRDYTNRPYLNGGSCVHFCSDGSFMKKCFKPSQKLNKDFERAYYEDYGLRKKRDTSLEEKYERKSKRDIYDDDTKDPWEYCRRSVWKFIFSIGITVGLCFLVLFLFRYSTNVLFILTILSTIALSILFAYIFWQLYWIPRSQSKGTEVFSILVTLLAVCGIIFSCCYIQSFRVVKLLYKEVARVIFTMPQLFVATAIIWFIQAAVLGFAICAVLGMAASTIIIKYDEYRAEFQQTSGSNFAIFLNIILTYWIMQIFAGIQCMTVSGSVAAWYFADNWLKSPVRKSFSNALKFHVGSACIVSLLQPFVAALKRVVVCLTRINLTENCCRVRCCFESEIKLQYLSKKNALIMTALHGEPFRKSGKRAYSLIFFMAPSFGGILSKSDFIMMLLQLNLIFYSTLLSTLLFLNSDFIGLPVLICFFTSVLTVGVFFETLDTVVHTLLITFCEDHFINVDYAGPHRPKTKNMEEIFKRAENLHCRYGSEN